MKEAYLLDRFGKIFLSFACFIWNFSPKKLTPSSKPPRLKLKWVFDWLIVYDTKDSYVDNRLSGHCKISNLAWKWRKLMHFSQANDARCKKVFRQLPKPGTTFLLKCNSLFSVGLYSQLLKMFRVQILLWIFCSKWTLDVILSIGILRSTGFLIQSHKHSKKKRGRNFGASYWLCCWWQQESSAASFPPLPARWHTSRTTPHSHSAAAHWPAAAAGRRWPRHSPPCPWKTRHYQRPVGNCAAFGCARWVGPRDWASPWHRTWCPLDWTDRRGRRRRAASRTESWKFRTCAELFG